MSISSDLSVNLTMTGGELSCFKVISAHDSIAAWSFTKMILTDVYF